MGIENPRVGGSIPPQATNKVNDLAHSFLFLSVELGQMARDN